MINLSRMRTPIPSRQRSYRYGLHAEKLAALYLCAKGYRILRHRHLGHLGEIDLIAMRGRTVAIVEVKARQNFTQCHHSITPTKQQKLLRATQEWMSGVTKVSGRPLSDCSIRFDVIWVVPWRWPQHIKDAWRP